MNRNDLYKEYVATIFAEFHDIANLDREYRRHRHAFRRNLMRYLPPDRNAYIVDIGCGLGHFVRFTQELGYRNAHGIDLSEENVRLCRERGLEVQCVEARQFLTGRSGAYDFILLLDVVEHIPKEEIVPLLAAVRAALRPGGRAVVRTDNMSNPFLASDSRYADITHEVGFTEVSLKQVLRLAGFQSIQVHPYDIYVLYGNPLNYPAKALSSCLNLALRLLCLLYGRKTARLFSKHIFAVAEK